MSRKPTKGYFIAGHFVAEGSERDLELRREREAGGPSRSEKKRESDELQALGTELLGLRAGLLDPLPLPDKLRDALAEARRITNFEGKRRQMQYVGKLMRQLDEATLEAARAALAEQHSGPAMETARLHEAERWREELIAGDDALDRWFTRFPQGNSQELRALIRQARKDARPSGRPGEAPRQGKSYRELFQLIRQQLDDASDEA